MDPIIQIFLVIIAIIVILVLVRWLVGPPNIPEPFRIIVWLFVVAVILVGLAYMFGLV